MSALGRLGVAARHLLKAQQALEDARAEFHASIINLYQATPVLRKREVGPIVRNDLTLHGYQPDQISRLGVSDASMRVILREAKHLE